jgi:hypothetical protein
MWTTIEIVPPFTVLARTPANCSGPWGSEAGPAAAEGRAANASSAAPTARSDRLVCM